MSLILVFTGLCDAQENNKIKTLNLNKIQCEINPNKSVFNNINGLDSYSFKDKKDINLLSIFSMTIGYSDSINEYRLVRVPVNAKDYYDLINGPYSDLLDLQSNISYVKKREKKIWKISKQQIADHKLNWKDTNYIIPEDIKTWPANPLVDYSEHKNLAPFIDLNNDGIYSPEKGEYPKIKGDEAVYYILNGGIFKHNNQAIELHTLIYQYNNHNSILDSTTFVSYKIINRNKFDLNNINSAVDIFKNIGNPTDDLIGTDSLRNLLFFYNADNFDESNKDYKGLGKDLIAVGLVGLNNTIKSSMYWALSSSQSLSHPNSEFEYKNFMNGKWSLGDTVVYGGNGFPGSVGSTKKAANFVFPSDPLMGKGWTALNSKISNVYGGLYNNSKFNLKKEESIDFEYAIVTAKNKDTILCPGLRRLYENVDSIQLFYDNSNEKGFPKTSNVDNNIYPQGELFHIIPTPIIGDTNNIMISRLDGRGNGKNWLELSKISENEIVKNGYVKEVIYEPNKAPIIIEIQNDSKLKEGYYELKFIDYKLDTSISFTNYENMYVDSSKLKLIRFDKKGGVKLDSIAIIGNISSDSIFTIENWGFKIKLNQIRYKEYEVYDDKTNFLDKFYVNPINETIDKAIIYKDSTKKWLDFVCDVDVFATQNWIRSGNFESNSNATSLGYKNPILYTDFFKLDKYKGSSISVDPYENYEKILNGGIAPFCLVRTSSNFMPFINHTNYGFGSNYARLYSTFSRLTNVDVVFTSDTSKWTRCPVFELGVDAQMNEGKATPGGLRKGSSIDKSGNKISGSTGMGWFPGYAIDIETGKRLHLAFGENSSLINQNGRDMKWNPDSTKHNYVYDNGKNAYDTIYNVEGTHPIYIYGTNVHGYRNNSTRNCPFYDGQNNWVYDQVKLGDSTGSYNFYYGSVYISLQWVINPKLKSGHNLLSSDVKLKVRLEKRYNDYTISGVNNGRPAFSWNIGAPKTSLVNNIESSDFDVKIYPNPNNGSFKMIVSEQFVGQQYQLINVEGKIVKNGTLNSNFEIIDLQSVSGLYFLKIGDKSFKFQIFE